MSEVITAESPHAELKWVPRKSRFKKLVVKIVKTGDDLDIEFIFPFLEAKVPSNCDCSDNARMD